MTGKEQREYITNLIGIKDYHKSKTKGDLLPEKKNVNEEEIEIDI